MVMCNQKAFKSETSAKLLFDFLVEGEIGRWNNTNIFPCMLYSRKEDRGSYFLKDITEPKCQKKKVGQWFPYKQKMQTSFGLS